MTPFSTSAKTKKEPCPDCIKKFQETTAKDGGIILVDHADCLQALNYREPIGYRAGAK